MRRFAPVLVRAVASQGAGALHGFGVASVVAAPTVSQRYCVEKSAAKQARLMTPEEREAQAQANIEKIFGVKADVVNSVADVKAKESKAARLAAMEAKEAQQDEKHFGPLTTLPEDFDDDLYSPEQLPLTPAANPLGEPWKNVVKEKPPEGSLASVDKHFNPLHEAVLNNNAAAVRKLVLNKGDMYLNQRTLNGNTPMHLAADIGSSSVLAELAVNNNANFCAMNKFGETPTMVADRRRHMHVVDFLAARERASRRQRKVFHTWNPAGKRFFIFLQEMVFAPISFLIFVAMCITFAYTSFHTCLAPRKERISVTVSEEWEGGLSQSRMRSEKAVY